MRAFALLCSALLVCGCDDGPIDPSAATSVTLTISSPDVMTSAGDTRSMTAVVRNADGSVASAPLVWSSSAPAVAAVSGSGAGATITAVEDGAAIITAAAGSIQGTTTVTVRRKLASVELSAAASVLTFGKSTQLTATARDARQNPMPGVTGFTYSSSDSGTVVVSTTGVVTGLFSFREARTATITARVTSDGVTASVGKQISVIPPADFDHVALMLTENERPERVPTLGLGIAFFSIAQSQIDYTVTWSALSGPAIEAHIHLGTASDIGDVLVDLAPRGQIDNHGALIGAITAANIRPQTGGPISLDSLIALMSTGKAYVDVHTATFATGEVRGQVFGPFETGLRLTPRPVQPPADDERNQ